MKLDDPGQGNGPITIHYNDYEADAKVGEPKTMEVDVIGADGANSRVAKNIDAGEYDYAIAFQERIKIPARRWSTTRTSPRCRRRRRLRFLRLGVPLRSRRRRHLPS